MKREMDEFIESTSQLLTKVCSHGKEVGQELAKRIDQHAENEETRNVIWGMAEELVTMMSTRRSVKSRRTRTPASSTSDSESKPKVRKRKRTRTEHTLETKSEGSEKRTAPRSANRYGKTSKKKKREEETV